MTVLQQLRSYINMNSVQAVNRKLPEKLVTAEGLKTHPSPVDYFAERLQQRDDEIAATPHLLSETV